MKLGSEGNDAVLLEDHGVKRACGVGRGNAGAPVGALCTIPLYILL